jgi:hypothetical protein
MKRQRILGTLIAFLTLASMFILTKVVSKRVVNDSLLIEITSWGFYLIGIVACWMMLKIAPD